MQRPVGYTVISVLVALFSLAGVPALLWSPHEALGIQVPVLLIGLQAVALLAGFVAAWAIWSVRSWAPEAYAAWAALGVAAAVCFQLVVAPQILARVAEVASGAGAPPTPPMGALLFGVAVQAALLGLGYWYLRMRRPPAV